MAHLVVLRIVMKEAVKDVTIILLVDLHWILAFVYMLKRYSFSGQYRVLNSI
jgi:hypothetical protein